MAKNKDDIVSDLITLTEAAGLIFLGFIMLRSGMAQLAKLSGGKGGDGAAGMFA